MFDGAPSSAKTSFTIWTQLGFSRFLWVFRDIIETQVLTSRIILLFNQSLFKASNLLFWIQILLFCIV